MSEQLIIEHHRIKGQARAYKKEIIVNLVSLWVLQHGLYLTNYNPVHDEWQTNDGEIYSTDNILNNGAVLDEQGT